MKNFYLLFREISGSVFLCTMIAIVLASGTYASEQKDSVKLYTPYTKISVPPGQSVDYSIDLINNSTGIRNVDISLSGVPRGWTYDLKSGGWKIGQLSVLPGERKSINLKVDVPLMVNKGLYRFKVLAGSYDVLPLVVTVTEQGTFKTELSSTQLNMQGRANSTFTYNANLKNSTAEKQLYALIANAQRGWTVTFKANYQPVTSVSIEPNSTQALTIEVKPPENALAGTYKIPIGASTNTTSASLELEAVVTGTFGMELTTPTGLLSTDITAGEAKRTELVVTNTGSTDLQDIRLEAAAPLKWEVTFDPKTIAKLEPGKSEHVFATIKADKKAIPGDYVTNLEAKTPENSSKLSFRISVETRMLWGWIGVLIIIAAVGSVFYLFRKYGRR